MRLRPAAELGAAVGEHAADGNLVLVEERHHPIVHQVGFADAILDRLVHNSYRLTLAGPSLRNPEAAAAETTSADPEVAAGSKTIVHAKPAKGAKK